MHISIIFLSIITGQYQSNQTKINDSCRLFMRVDNIQYTDSIYMLEGRIAEYYDGYAVMPGHNEPITIHYNIEDSIMVHQSKGKSDNLFQILEVSDTSFLIKVYRKNEIEIFYSDMEINDENKCRW